MKKRGVEWYSSSRAPPFKGAVVAARTCASARAGHLVSYVVAILRVCLRVFT